MLTEALVALATTASTTLAAAMATDAWQLARSKFAKLLSRGNAEQQTSLEAQLDRNEMAVRQADAPDQTRLMLAPSWHIELTTLLAAHPEAAAELAELVDQIRAALPAQQQQWISVVQNVTASGTGAVAAGAIFGNVTQHVPERDRPSGET